MTKVIQKEMLEKVIKLDKEAIDCIENAFRIAATKEVIMPPIMRLDIKEHNGEIDVKSAYVPGLDSFAIKMSPGFFDNPKKGLPSLNGLMILFSSYTGLVEAVLLDQGFLTNIRTAAAGGGVAVRWLSRKNSRRLTIIGAGMQAQLQAQAALLERDFEEIHLWTKFPEESETYISRMRAAGVTQAIIYHDDIKDAIAQGDVVISATPSTEPLITKDMLKKGQTIIAMGSDSEHKQEIDADVFSAIDLYICDSQKQTAILGELQFAIAQGIVAADAIFPEIGQIIAGQKEGRTHDDQIILCDLTGTGLQDTAIANLAKEKLS